MASHPIMQFRAELMEAHIPIWRRFQVMDDLRFSRLAYILMTMFEMQASHLFAFTIDRAKNKLHGPSSIEIKEQIAKDLIEEDLNYLRVEILLEEDWTALAPPQIAVSTVDARKWRIKDEFTHVGNEAIFEYDFGDDWEVCVTLEEVCTAATCGG